MRDAHDPAEKAREGWRTLTAGGATARYRIAAMLDGTWAIHIKTQQSALRPIPRLRNVSDQSLVESLTRRGRSNVIRTAPSKRVSRTAWTAANLSVAGCHLPAT